MIPGKLAKTILSAGLGVTIAFTSVTPGPSRSAAAATVYETTIEWGVNLRAEPRPGAKVYRQLPRGEKVHVLSQVNAYWLKIKRKDGRIGYISADSKYTDYTVTGDTAERVIAIAKSYMGRVSYDYGTRNASRLIFDCSSFTQFVFGKAGVELKWGTKHQKKQGSAVSKHNLRQGDLVFFDTIGANNRSINHVGIYMGGGQFIHNTPSKDGLAVNRLDQGWWEDHYVSARRVL